MTTDLAVRRPIPLLRRDWTARSSSSGRYAVQRVVGELVESYRRRHAQRFAYDGATAGRRAYGWYAASADANVELMGALIWLRNRSRELIRNNPYAARAIEELAGAGWRRQSALLQLPTNRRHWARLSAAFSTAGTERP